jgi:hypothetical protein
MCDVGQIENDPILVVPNQGFDLLFELTAIGARMDAAFHVEDGDAVQLPFIHMNDHDRTSIPNSRFSGTDTAVAHGASRKLVAFIWKLSDQPHAIAECVE